MASATATQGDCSQVVSGTFTCDIGSMVPQASVTITALIVVDPTAIGRLVVNRTIVRSAVPDANVRNNTVAYRLVVLSADRPLPP